MSFAIEPGYMGYATIDGSIYRCTEMSVAPSQEPLFYDHVIGLKDTIPFDSSTKGVLDDGEEINPQKILWRPSTISYEGSIAFPVMDISSGCLGNTLNLFKVFRLAKYAIPFDIELNYNCLVGRKFTDCKINTFSLNITSGDILTVNISIIGMGVESLPVESGGIYEGITDTYKLVTWDKVLVTSPILDTTQNQSFSLEINNNINTIYTHGSLSPRELRVGMQTVSGSLTLYNKHGTLNIPIDAKQTVLNLDIVDFSTKINCVLQPSSIDGAISSIFSTISFKGVDKAFGD